MIKRKHSLLSKKIDIIFLILAPIFAVVIALVFKVNYFTNIVLFFFLPAIYLSIRNTHAIKKSIVFALFVGIIGGFLTDFLATFNNSWLIVETIFPFKILGILPLEDIIWGFLLVYDIIMFYEHFLDKGRHNLKDTRLKYFIILFILLLIIFLLTYLFNPSFLSFKYFYLFYGLLIMLLPTISFLSFFPRLISKFIKTGAYFLILSILYEFSGLYLNQWEFRGNNFIGWVNFFNIKIPFEELFFYLILFTICILSYYEFFDDDRK